MKFAVCDDEKYIRLDIIRYIKQYLPKALICSFISGEQLLNYGEDIDILFIDIQMNGLNGMETARLLRERNRNLTIIFVTAYENYVFEAFDVNAFHYLMKPIDPVKFFTVLEHAIAQCNNQDTLKRIIIKSKSTACVVYNKDIYYAEIFNRKVTIHTANGGIEYYAKLTDLETQLDQQFYRCHRSYLINLAYIASYSRNHINLTNSSTIPIASTKYAEFVKCYLHFLKKESFTNE